MQQLNLDYQKSAEARDKSLQQVEDNSDGWVGRALIQLEQLKRRVERTEFTGEDIRGWLVPWLGQPPHPNCMGALVCTAIRKNLIVDTGRMTRCKTVKRKASKTTLYQWS